MIYLDNAATSFPKPEECLRKALERYLQMGASPGRGSYDLAMAAEERVAALRQRLCRFLGGDDSYRLCFTYNATDALNILIRGLSPPGSHVVSSRLEHNSVLRPLHHLRKEGIITFDLVPFDGQGYLDPQRIDDAIRSETRLVILTHASNVLGTVQPVKEIAAACRLRKVPLVLDASQSAGAVPLRIKEWDVQGIAFTGHKSLLGPTGIGGLLLSPELNPEPTKFGGTGVDSHNLYHPQGYPHRLEAGTLNLFGVLALDECLDYVERSQPESYAREMGLLGRLKEGLERLPRVHLYGIEHLEQHLPLLTCSIDGHHSEDVGAILDADYDIAVRAGLHCAPLVHQDLGTLKEGAVRFSLGPFLSESDIDEAIRAMTAIGRGYPE